MSEIPGPIGQRSRESEQTAGAGDSEAAQGRLRRPVPGPTFRVVRWVSAIDAIFFGLLLFFWLAPGYEHPTMYAGWAHGLGFIALCLVIWIAILRREAPYGLLAATLTPVGPFGSVIAIELIDRRGWGVARSDEAA